MQPSALLGHASRRRHTVMPTASKPDKADHNSDRFAERRLRTHEFGPISPGDAW